MEQINVHIGGGPDPDEAWEYQCGNCGFSIDYTGDQFFLVNGQRFGEWDSAKILPMIKVGKDEKDIWEELVYGPFEEE